MKSILWLILMIPILILAGCGSMGYGPGSAWGYMGYGAGMWIIFLILVGIIVFFMWRGDKGGAFRGGTKETPLEILERRYASGEITKEKFEEMKRDLGL